MLFKKGDRVRILRKARTREKGGGNSWIPEYMNAAVGKIGTVIFVNAELEDVELRVPHVADTWGYPAFVLKKIQKFPAKRSLKG